MGELNKPKVGVILASHKREPSSFSLELLKKGLERLSKEGIEIFFNGKYATNDQEVRTEIKNLKLKDVDLYMVVPGNWVEPPVLCHPLEEIRYENILLLGFTESLRLIRDGHFLGSNSAFTVLRNAMSQMGFRFNALQGFLEEKEISIKIRNIAWASYLSRLIRKIKLGLIGYCSLGIYTACFDLHKVRNVFGIEIDTSADSFILYKNMEEVEANEISDVKSILAEQCEIHDEIINNDSLEKSIRMYIALKKMALEKDWKGLSVKCQNEFSTYLRCTACLPLSMLTDEGIMCTDEGDIHALITMVIMSSLISADVPIYFGDIYKLKEGGFLMDHCGLSPHKCASENSKISLIPQNPRISIDGKTTGGVVSSYEFREGLVTIGRIENNREGNYFFHFCKGRVKPIESVAYGWSTLVFTPDCNDDFFAENQLANHYIFVYEDIFDKLIEFSKLIGLKVIN
ncbi:MAG: hypothetical protein M1308_01400 [Actinobacteria bacterium]|nr:hypothetical protein [Actinomycetota bacterium]